MLSLGRYCQKRVEQQDTQLESKDHLVSEKKKKNTHWNLCQICSLIGPTRMEASYEQRLCFHFILNFPQCLEWNICCYMEINIICLRGSLLECRKMVFGVQQIQVLYLTCVTLGKSSIISLRLLLGPALAIAILRLQEPYRQVVLALEDSLLFQVKAKEIHNSPHPKAELSRGHHVESVARMIHLLCGVLARMRRMASVRSLLSAGVNGRWEVIVPCGEGTSLTLQGVCLPHSLPTDNSVPAHHCFSHPGLCTFSNGPGGHYCLC